MTKWSPEMINQLKSKMELVDQQMEELKHDHPEGIQVLVPENVANLLGVLPGQEPTDIVELLG